MYKKIAFYILRLLLYLFQRYPIVNLFDRLYSGVGAIAHNGSAKNAMVL